MTRTKASATKATPANAGDVHTSQARRADTATSLLAMIHAKYDFGPQTNARIKVVLAVPTPAPVPVDPLLSPPYGLLEHTIEYPTHIKSDGIVLLGSVHGHTARIIPPGHSKGYAGCATFAWGCARELSQSYARNHWRDGRSRVSNAERPKAEVLLQWVKAICDHRGWAW